METKGGYREGCDENGTTVIFYKDNGQTNQQWNFIQSTDVDYMCLENGYARGRYLDN